MGPKGKLLIIGGAEERSGNENLNEEEKKNQAEQFKILKGLLPSAKRDDRIEVITTASSVPEEMEKIYQKTFREIGFKNFGFLDIRDKMQAREEQLVKRIQKAKAVFFTGGDQLRLATIITGTSAGEAIKQKYSEEKDFLVAGTSAGAMIMSATMISGGGITEALLGADIQTASGLGLIDNCIIDTHFIKRGRFSRLAHAVVLNPGNLGIGLGENTALLIKDGCEATCIGTGMVVLIDGSKIERTNISEADKGTPVYVENLVVHLLVQHCKFHLATHEMEV